MKRSLAFCLAVLCSGAYADAVMRHGKDMLRIAETPCTNAGILAQIVPEWRDKFRAANAIVNGKAFEACWIGENQGGVYVLFEDGDEGRFAWKDFKAEAGI